MSQSIIYIINDSEIGAGTRGSSLASGALRVVDDNRGDYLFARYPIHYVETMNHVLDKPTPFTFAKRIDGMVQLYKNIANVVGEERKQNDFLLVVSGDHASAGGTLAGLKIANPSHRIGALWIDAHADIHTPYTTPSGNLHGMVVATALNVNNKICQKNIISSEEAELWDKLKNIGGIAPKIDNKNLAYIGVRDMEEEEDKLLERKVVHQTNVEQLRSKGVASVVNRLESIFSDCDEIYVSFDVDSMDPELTSHGTGTPVPNGITPEEARELLVYYANHPKVKCIEFVEINPCLDEKVNKMAEITYDLVKAVVETVENKK